MNILDKVKNLFFGAKTEPIRQTIPQTSPSLIFSTIEESQKNKIELWAENQDVVKGLEFCATMQLRTTLRVLMKHGELHADLKTNPPKIPAEMWEGIWIAKLKSFRELGFPVNDFPDRLHASEIGPVIPADYLPFLIAVRTIVETHEPVETRIEKLMRMPLATELAVFAQKHGGMNELAERFFPTS